MNSRTRLVLACLLPLCVATAVQAATAYRWVDSNGQVHYGQVPPKSGSYDVIQGSRPATPATSAPASGGAVKPDDQRARERAFIERADAERKAKSEAKEQCAAARKQLNDFERRANAPLATVGEDGKITPLTQDEVRGRLDQARQAAAKACAEGG